jgi:hypothetical protein
VLELSEQLVPQSFYGMKLVIFVILWFLMLNFSCLKHGNEKKSKSSE